MNHLNDIAKLVTSQLRKNVALSAFLGPDTAPWHFFRALQQGAYTDDDTAARHCFGTTSSDRRYITLKSKVLQQLLRMLLFLDLKGPEYSSYMKARYRCNRLLVCMKLLAQFGKRSSARVLAERLLHLSRRYHLTDCSIVCLRQLRHAAALEGKAAEFERCDTLLWTYLELQRQELYARELAETIQVQFARSISVDAGLLQTAKRHCRELDALRATHHSRELQLYYFRLMTLTAEIARDFDAGIRACDELEEYFHRNPHLRSNSRTVELTLSRLHGCLFLKHYAEGRRYAEQALQLLQSGDFNWFSCLEYYFLLEMHSGEYTRADRIFRMATGHSNIGAGSPQRREKWKIFEAYLRFALEHPAGSRGNSGADLFNEKFNVYKFLNELPVFSRDKRGFNVAILIVHFLFLLKHNDFDKLLDRANNLRWYCSTYLRPENQYRSNCFIRLILLVINKQFDPREIRAAAGPLLQGLANARPDYVGKFDTLEVIPFGNLWDMILGELCRIEREKAFIRVQSSVY